MWRGRTLYLPNDGFSWTYSKASHTPKQRQYYDIDYDDNLVDACLHSYRSISLNRTSHITSAYDVDRPLTCFVDLLFVFVKGYLVGEAR